MPTSFLRRIHVSIRYGIGFAPKLQPRRFDIRRFWGIASGVRSYAQEPMP